MEVRRLSHLAFMATVATILGVACAGDDATPAPDPVPSTAAGETTAITSSESGQATVVTTTAGPAAASPTTTQSDGVGDSLFPDVIAATVTRTQTGYRFDVTMSSPYDSPERYADAWRVRDADGTVYGVRELLHDHAAEQPFTRSLDAVEIPDDVRIVIIEGRDQLNGWGGATIDVEIPQDE